jgi:hypothetical protein
MSVLHLVLMLFLVGGQSTPDFSGHWFINKATLKPSPTRPYWPVCGWDCTIAHTAAGLTVTPTTGTSRTFVIGGTPVTTTIEGFGQATTQTTSTRWEQQRLVVTVMTGTGDEFSSTTQLSIDGTRLVVTTTRGGRRGGGQETATYTKK